MNKFIFQFDIEACECDAERIGEVAVVGESADALQSEYIEAARKAVETGALDFTFQNHVFNVHTAVNRIQTKDRTYKV